MTLLSIFALIVLAFIGGWFGGYKKACDAHGWNLPGIDWNRARGRQRFWRMGARRSIISHGVSFGGGFIAWTVRKSHLAAHIIERITQNARGYRRRRTVLPRNSTGAKIAMLAAGNAPSH
jgi:hypothetical protein